MGKNDKMIIEEYKSFMDKLTPEDLKDIKYFNHNNVNYGKKFAKGCATYRLDPYENPKTTQKNISELQEILVQTCIDYIKKNDLTDIYSVSFSVDSLQESVEYNEWTPSSDSYISVCGIEKDSMECFCVRKLIGENF